MLLECHQDRYADRRGLLNGRRFTITAFCMRCAKVAPKINARVWHLSYLSGIAGKEIPEDGLILALAKFCSQLWFLYPFDFNLPFSQFRSKSSLALCLLSVANFSNKPSVGFDFASIPISWSTCSSPRSVPVKVRRRLRIVLSYSDTGR